MRSTEIRPDFLPAIDAVEIVDLSRVDANHADGYMAAGIDAPRVRLAGSVAQAIAGLWRSLPEGEQARCHLPPYGLRFLSGDEFVAEASICWQCNNIFGRTPDGGFWIVFDAQAPASTRLLETLRENGPRAKG